MQITCMNNRTEHYDGPNVILKHLKRQPNGNLTMPFSSYFHPNMMLGELRFDPDLVGLLIRDFIPLFGIFFMKIFVIMQRMLLIKNIRLLSNNVNDALLDRRIKERIRIPEETSFSCCV